MSKAPAFQFYAQDFLTGVTYLTNEEIGIYIKMLCKQWTDNRIPKERLRFLTGYDWDKLSKELQSKFIDKGEYVINKRLEEERESQLKRAVTSRENGRKGGRPPKNQNLKKPNTNPEESSSMKYEDRSMKIEEENDNEDIANYSELEREPTEFDIIYGLWVKFAKQHLGTIPKSTNADQIQFEDLIARIGRDEPNVIELFRSIFDSYERWPEWHKNNSIELRKFTNQFYTIFKNLKDGQKQSFTETIGSQIVTDPSFKDI